MTYACDWCQDSGLREVWNDVWEEWEIIDCGCKASNKTKDL